MSLLPRVLACVGGSLALGAALALPTTGLAQTDYSRGKTPPQLFASDCSACHRTPQGLAAGRDARALTAFLHDHYTTKIEWAGLLANYLVGVGGAKSQRAPVTSPTAAPATAAPAPAATTPAATGSAATEPAAPVPPASVPSAAAAPTAAPVVRGARPDEAPSATQEENKRTAVSARERGKPADPRGPKGKPDPERDAGAKAGGETLQAKLRSYATGGEEAKPVSPAATGAPVPGLRPSAGPGAQPPRSDGGASAGVAKPTPGSPDAAANR
jgi:hypothetical protein